MVNQNKTIRKLWSKITFYRFFSRKQQAVVWRGPMGFKSIKSTYLGWDWGDLDYLLVDLPPGTGDIHLSLVQSLPVTGAVVVTTPQTIAFTDARKGVNMFQLDSINVPVLGVVENMAYFTPEELPKINIIFLEKKEQNFI